MYSCQIYRYFIKIEGGRKVCVTVFLNPSQILYNYDRLELAKSHPNELRRKKPEELILYVVSLLTKFCCKTCFITASFVLVDQTFSFCFIDS